MIVHEQHADGGRFFHDVENPTALVTDVLHRSGIALSQWEFEELHGEGLIVLTRMAREWCGLPACCPSHTGHKHARKGRFAGYAVFFLHRRLGDAWHRLHPEHRYVTDPATGKRGWRYGKPTISLDALTEGDDAHGLDHALHTARRPHEFLPIAFSTQAA